MKTFVICFLCILVGFLISYRWKNIEYIEDNTKTLQLYKEIDSLNKIIESVSYRIDSLQNVIDTSKKEIVNITIEYEEKYLELYNAPISKHIDFFSNYLSEGN